MLKIILSSKAMVSSTLMAVLITMCLGLFANAPATQDDSFSGKYWYYINRGYPEPFVGWTLQGTTVAFPHLKLPFVVAQDGEPLEKIVDIKKAAPVLSSFFLVLYLPSFTFAKVVDENKKAFPLWIIGNCVIFAVGLAVYFFLFPRI